MTTLYLSLVPFAEQSLYRAGRSSILPLVDFPHITRVVSSFLFDMQLLSSLASGAAGDVVGLVSSMAAIMVARLAPCKAVFVSGVGVGNGDEFSVGKHFLNRSFAHLLARRDGTFDSSDMIRYGLLSFALRDVRHACRNAVR